MGRYAKGLLSAALNINYQIGKDDVFVFEKTCQARCGIC